MAKFSEMPPMARLGIIVVVAVLLSGAFYYLGLQPLYQQNRIALASLKAKQEENATLKQYEPKLADLDRRMASLRQQVEQMKRIVPDEKEADKFIHVITEQASNAGVEVRRFTTQPVATREFYTEAPFEIDIDGPYYGVLDFFERVRNLERIINIEGLKMASVKKPTGAVKKTYQYAPGESVVAGCVAKTFYSHEVPAASAATPAAPAAK